MTVGRGKMGRGEIVAVEGRGGEGWFGERTRPSLSVRGVSFCRNDLRDWSNDLQVSMRPLRRCLSGKVGQERVIKWS